jgi:hypothetical protein
MSKSLLHGLNKISKNNIPVEVQLVLTGVGVAGHALYSYSTFTRDTIQIHKKYTFTRNSNTQFMIIDQDNKHYNINNSFWYWKWDSIEDWSTLRENDSINIKYYGYRVPLLGFFPNIICSKDKSENFKIDKMDTNDEDFLNMYLQF